MKHTAETTNPRIYVACFAAYNAGKLHGRWIDAKQKPDEIQDAIQQILATSPEPGAEEWAIHDYEGFGSLNLSEHVGIERVCELAAFIEEHGQLGAELMNYVGGSLEEARQSMVDNYCGEYESLEHYAEQFAEDCGYLNQVPENLRNYINFESMGRDMELNGDIFTLELSFQELHVFWSR